MMLAQASMLSNAGGVSTDHNFDGSFNDFQIGKDTARQASLVLPD
jgi:hypothetical protein